MIGIDTTQGSQWATVMTSSSYLLASDVRAHCGLGPETTVKTVKIRWPSGIRQTLNDVQGGRYVRVDEPTGTNGKQP